MIKQDKIKATCGEMDYLLEPGVRKKSAHQIQISVWCPNAVSCNLRIYQGKEKICFPMFMPENKSLKGIYTVSLQGMNISQELQGLEYDFSIGDTTFVDPYATEIVGGERFGKKRKKIKARFDFSQYDWEDENWLTIPSDQMVIYQCHVRGFTKHSSSGVTAPGTFLGLQEKIPYLKQLGVNTLFLLPVYEFDERMKGNNAEETEKINYWGYGGQAFYFAPKQAYASGNIPSTLEFQQMIKALHSAGMNVFLDMYFDKQSPLFVLQCLRYYALRYHVDGFRVNPGILEASWISDDPVLSRVRFLGTDWKVEQEEQGQDHFFQMKDQFMIDARCFLKSDEGQIQKFYYGFREQGKGVGLVHYITQHNGFTLRDLISYDRKHNEANGENNRDGTDYNYSWNCGAEGPSRKKAVLRWRQRQEKNALVMFLLGMPIPMLLAGDEFGNSQKGNNNAYCQDNITTWLDWRLLEKNRELLDFVKKLLQIRKNSNLYHQKELLTGLDAKALGVPDVSCHGREPWSARFSRYSREMGILYCGDYFQGQSLYFAFNFHWESHEFYLPDAKQGEKWKVLFDTSGQELAVDEKRKYIVQARSIVLFQIDRDRKGSKKKKTKK